MNGTLRELYDSFYTPPEMTEERAEVTNCHRRLIKPLSEERRKLALRIIDA